MKHISKFFEYKTEDLDLDQDEKEIDSNSYSDIISEVKEMIESSLKSNDDKLFKDFIDAAIQSPEETQIEGLINDSDVYDFYLKWRNEIDDILSQLNFYEEIPSEIKVSSLYDYIIVGTKRSITEIISMIKEEE